MTGHHVRRIMSSIPGMMTARAGSPDILPEPADQRKHSRNRNLDIMTAPPAGVILDHLDLRKHASHPIPTSQPDIMSTTPTTATIRSGRRNP